MLGGKKILFCLVCGVRLLVGVNLPSKKPGEKEKRTKETNKVQRL